MQLCSTFLNPKSIADVRIFRNANGSAFPYYPIMLDWFLGDWLKTLQVSQADLVRATDYPKAKVSDLVTGKQRYNRDILNDIARALNIEPHELLMHPDDANAIKRMRRLAHEMTMPAFGGVAGDEKAETRKAG
jgi:transcriptional regulator with XRE-family HTH domain